MTTIVSCYYKTKISKHSHESYDNWIRAFVLNLQEVNIIVFTQASDKQYLTDIFEQNKHVNYKIVVKELTDFEIVQKYPDVWEHQEKIDPQQHISRRKECYIIWNSKFNFVKEFNLRGVPTTVLINKKGEEFARIIGIIDFQDKKFLKWLAFYD